MKELFEIMAEQSGAPKSKEAAARARMASGDSKLPFPMEALTSIRIKIKPVQKWDKIWTSHA